MSKKTSALISFLAIFSAVICSLTINVYSQNEVQSFDIVVDSYSFEPNEITVKVNKPVELRLRSVTSIIPHNFSINYPDAGLVIDEDIGSGKDVTVTFTPAKAGEYEFYCGKKSIFANHKKKGMVGKLVVTE